MHGVQLGVVRGPRKGLGRLRRHGGRALGGVRALAQAAAPLQLRLAVVLRLLLGRRLLLQELLLAHAPPLLVAEDLVGGRVG